MQPDAIVRYIDRHLSDPKLCVDGVARVFGISGRHFTARPWPPDECRRALAVAMNSLEELDDLGAPLRSQVRDALNRANLVLERVRTQGEAPEMIGLVVTKNVLARHIRSGKYHSYRGMLSMSGNYLLHAFHAVTTQLAHRGYITPEDAQAATQQIREVG